MTDSPAGQNQAGRTQPISITKQHLLVVEGQEEVRFFGALMRDLEVDEMQVLPMHGKRNLPGLLRILPLLPNFADLSSLGIVRDADGETTPNHGGAFRSVQDALRGANLPVPNEPLATAGTAPRVAAMILPGDDSIGFMLEDLCLQSVRQDPAVACVDAFFECISESGLPMPRNLSKARIHAFLASRSNPELRLGEAAERGYWPWNSSSFDRLKGFVRQLMS